MKGREKGKNILKKLRFRVIWDVTRHRMVEGRGTQVKKGVGVRGGGLLGLGGAGRGGRVALPELLHSRLVGCWSRGSIRSNVNSNYDN